MAKTDDGLVEVRTSMRPNKPMRVTPLEQETLRRQGVLKDDEKPAPAAQKEG